MSRYMVTLSSADERERACNFIKSAPTGTRVEFDEAKRSPSQNDRLWLMLTAVSRQLKWQDQFYRPEDWKDYFMHALRGEKWMPCEDGGAVAIGRSTSTLGKQDFGDLMTLIEAFCARHAVKLPWDQEAAAQ